MQALKTIGFLLWFALFAIYVTGPLWPPVIPPL
jgi:hypothetical protein